MPSFQLFKFLFVFLSVLNLAIAAPQRGNNNGNNGNNNGNNNNNNGNTGNNGNNGNNGGAGGTSLDAANVQDASASDGNPDQAAGQSASLTDDANFINFCSGKTITNGQQNTGGSCNGIVMGDIPSQGNMISSIIVNPAPGDNIQANQDFDIQVQVSNLVAGTFTNPDVTYYAAPQQLQGGRVVGHTHVTVQDLGNSLTPNNPPDASTFAFFKGINDNGNGNGLLSATVAGGLPAGNYRVCTMTSSSNHQPVLMPVAQRGAQDDCTKFTVGGNGGNNNNNANGGNNNNAGNAGNNNAGNGQNNAGNNNNNNAGNNGANNGNGNNANANGNGANANGNAGNANGNAGNGNGQNDNAAGNANGNNGNANGDANNADGNANGNANNANGNAGNANGNLGNTEGSGATGNGNTGNANTGTGNANDNQNDGNAQGSANTGNQADTGAANGDSTGGRNSNTGSRGSRDNGRRSSRPRSTRAHKMATRTSVSGMENTEVARSNHVHRNDERGHSFQTRDFVV